jgi:tetratricopeptide (TPR) repeat protein
MKRLFWFGLFIAANLLNVSCQVPLSPSTPAGNSVPEQPRESRATAERTEAPLPEEASPAVSKLAIGAALPVTALGVSSCRDSVERSSDLINRRELAEAREVLGKTLETCPDLAPALYNLASLESIAGNLEKSEESLHRALEANFLRYSERMKTDSDLEALRESERWTSFLERVEPIRATWAKALAEEGAFLLFKRPERDSVLETDGFDDTSYPAMRGDERLRWRGEPYFFHVPPQRTLPLGRFPNSMQLFFDDENHRLYVFQSARLITSLIPPDFVPNGNLRMIA